MKTPENHGSVLLSFVHKKILGHGHSPGVLQNLLHIVKIVHFRYYSKIWVTETRIGAEEKWF